MTPPLWQKVKRNLKALDESERGEWKSWLKAQHSENEDHGIWSHHFMGNRWGNSGNSVSSVTQSCPTLCDPMNCSTQASLSITISQNSLRLMAIESVMPSSHLILCRPLLLLPPILPSIRVFSNELTLLIRWPKYWSFSFSIIPSKEHPGLISFRMDWLDLLAVQGTLKSLLQHHSSKASILQCSAFFFLFPLKLCQTLFFWAPKSLQMVTSAVTLKDAYSLEEKLWPT